MAVERVREGQAPGAVIASYGFCRTTLYKWLGHASSRGRGINALASRKGTGRPRKLTPRPARQVFRWINGKNPRPYGCDVGLWPRQIVRELVAMKFDVSVSLASVGARLARLGLTAQTPLQRAYQRDPEAIARGQREPYPALAAQAKRDGSAIYFWDESGVRADSVQGKTWAPIGQTPVVNVPGPRQGIRAASAVNAKGAFWFTTDHGALNGESFVARLKQWMHRRKNPVRLVLDGVPAHKTKAVKTYVASTQGRLTLHLLPGSAPELNPDELVWSHAKRTGHARRPLQKGERLEPRVAAQLAKIGNNPKLVRSCFRHPSVAYITDL